MQKIFQRAELKFLINDRQKAVIEQELLRYMERDPYCGENGCYMIYNLYFDTENDAIIRKSLQKPYYKEKLRLRSYRSPLCDEDEVFLELKKKIGGVVSKRRATVTKKEADSFLKSGVFLTGLAYTDKQVLREIGEFLSRYAVKPKVYLSYERTAYFGKEDREFRVTFDQNIITRREKVNFTDGDFGSELLDGDQVLMEVKVDGAMPLWFARLLSERKLYKTGFSKYGEEYRRYVCLHRSAEANRQVDTALTRVFSSGFMTA